MPARSFDVIVIGCGGFGSAVMSHLARRGFEVLGIDQFHPPHDMGSSHGETRVIRKAYFEHPNYVPLLHRAYELWDELTDRTSHLRSESEHDLFVRCGLLLAGSAHGEGIAGARETARQHQLDLPTLRHQDCRDRFPMFRIPESLDIVFEQDAGYLWVERCVAAHLADATSNGAALFPNRRVVAVEWQPGSVTVRTDDQQEIHAATAVFTAGAWTAELLPQYTRLIQVRRKTLFWLPITDSSWHDPQRSTVHLFDVATPVESPTVDNSSDHICGQFYGFPSVDGQTIKLAEHTGGQDHANVSAVDRNVEESESSRTTLYADQYLTGTGRKLVKSCVCYYSMSPDGHFLIDKIANAPIIVASGFSGHGFKFTSVIGQAVADLVQHGTTKLPVEFLSAARFSQT